MKLVENISSEFNSAFSPEIFFTVRGCENIHIYLWIAKDLCWITNTKILGMFFGLSAILWLGVLLHHAFVHKNNEEKYFLVPTFLWLFSNYLWMSGNLLYGTDIFRFSASCIMTVGIVLIVVYFFTLKNKEFFIPNAEVTKLYNENGLVCRFKSFDTWRRYELVHVFFWLLKDRSWCSKDPVFWIVGAIPTLFISLDFLYIGLKNRKMVIDNAHYLAQLLWVSSNIVWACVELFNIGGIEGDVVQERLSSHVNGRFVAEIILFAAYIPIVLLYIVWLPLSLSGKLNVQEPVSTEKYKNHIPIEEYKNPIHTEI